MGSSIENIKSYKVLLPLLLLFCGISVALGAMFGLMINALLIGIILGASCFYLAFTNPKYNVVILLTGSFITPFLIKAFNLYDIPFGVVNEALNLLLLFTLILNGRISGWKSLPGILLFVWIGWQTVELVNPMAPSRAASFLAIRGTIVSSMAFFIMYSSINSKKDIYTFFNAWFVLCVLAGAYAFYQEYVGLPDFDYAFANSSETIFNLLFTWGRMRKFSFFFSPTEFGVMMAYGGVIAIIFSFLDSTKKKQKAIYVIIALFLFWTMIFSGSRTSTILLPAGFLIFTLISLKRNVLISTAVFGLIGLGLVLRPTSNSSLFVMLTAFSADDPSLNVRLTNQQIIQSYIQENPIGFGLGSTGSLGQKYSPGNFISNFPPDSEYVKIAIESGWIGLFIWCSILATSFVYGVILYFKTNDKEYRNFLMISLCLLFMITITQYPQEWSPSLILMFSFTLGLIGKIGKITRTHEADLIE